jgi:hypothetical protein
MIRSWLLDFPTIKAQENEAGNLFFSIGAMQVFDL